MKLKVCFLDADSTEINGKTVVRLYCKDEYGKSVILLDERYKPAFYVLPEDSKVDVVKKRIESLSNFGVEHVEVEAKKHNLEEKKFLKVLCKAHSDVNKVRNIVKAWERARGGSGVIDEFEYTIPLHKKYLLENCIGTGRWLQVECEEASLDYRADLVAKLNKLTPCEEFRVPKLRMLAFDIETVEENGKKKIIAISFYSKDMKKVLISKRAEYPKDMDVEVIEDERAMLKRFVEIINEYQTDFLLGFATDQYDFRIIQERASALGVVLGIGKDKSKIKFVRRKIVSSAKTFGLVHIDIFSHILNILAPRLQTEVMTLGAISSELLGDTKIEMEFEEIIEAWRKEKKLVKLAEYCLKDSELVYRLSDLLLPQLFELCKIVCQPIFDVSRMTYGQLAEWYLMKYANESDYVILNSPKFDVIAERQRRGVYTGGYVKEPIPGIHENIVVFDFRSLYPSIIATFNISPETLNHCKDGYVVPELGHVFCKSHKGFVSSAIEKLILERQEIKKKLKETKQKSERAILENMQQAIKTVSNAMYGMMAFAGARWYCAECAASAAAFGRHYIKEMIKFATENGYKVLYADTDSMFIGDVKAKVDKFLEACNAHLPGLLKIEFQGFYKRGIFMPRETGIGSAKKRYALIDEKNNLLIRGLERVRGDWCRLARRTQEEVLDAVLRKKDVSAAIKIISRAIDALKKGKVDLKDLVIFELLSKSLNEYKVKSPHIVAAKKAIARGRPISEGSVIMYVIARGAGTVSDRAEPIEDVTMKDIDIDYYIKKQIIPPSLRVLVAMGISEQELYKKLGVEVE